jgi:hypothetical protein
MAVVDLKWEYWMDMVHRAVGLPGERVLSDGEQDEPAGKEAVGADNE